MENEGRPPAPVFLIVGATGGIGTELCRFLAGSGAHLALVARDAERLGELASELADSGASRILIRPADARRSEEMVKVVSDVVERYGRLDGAALLVGSILLKPIHLTSEQEWAETLDINLTPAFHLLRHAVRPMFKHGGSIVFVSTAAARIGLANHGAIAAAKAGLQGLALAAAATYASRGVRVNCVAPGLVDTPLAKRITGNEKAREASLSMHPRGRLGRAADVASAIAWLLDQRHDWITGQVIGVDGGLADLKVR